MENPRFHNTPDQTRQSITRLEQLSQEVRQRLQSNPKLAASLRLVLFGASLMPAASFAEAAHPVTANPDNTISYDYLESAPSSNLPKEVGFTFVNDQLDRLMANPESGTQFDIQTRSTESDIYHTESPNEQTIKSIERDDRGRVTIHIAGLQDVGDGGYDPAQPVFLKLVISQSAGQEQVIEYPAEKINEGDYLVVIEDTHQELFEGNKYQGVRLVVVQKEGYQGHDALASIEGNCSISADSLQSAPQEVPPPITPELDDENLTNTSETGGQQSTTTTTESTPISHSPDSPGHPTPPESSSAGPHDSQPNIPGSEEDSDLISKPEDNFDGRGLMAGGLIAGGVGLGTYVGWRLGLKNRANRLMGKKNKTTPESAPLPISPEQQKILDNYNAFRQEPGYALVEQLAQEQWRYMPAEARLNLIGLDQFDANFSDATGSTDNIQRYMASYYQRLTEEQASGIDTRMRDELNRVFRIMQGAAQHAYGSLSEAPQTTGAPTFAELNDQAGGDLEQYLFDKHQQIANSVALDMFISNNQRVEDLTAEELAQAQQAMQQAINARTVTAYRHLIKDIAEIAANPDDWRGSPANYSIVGRRQKLFSLGQESSSDRPASASRRATTSNRRASSTSARTSSAEAPRSTEAPGSVELGPNLRRELESVLVKYGLGLDLPVDWDPEGISEDLLDQIEFDLDAASQGYVNKMVADLGSVIGMERAESTLDKIIEDLGEFSDEDALWRGRSYVESATMYFDIIRERMQQAKAQHLQAAENNQASILNKQESIQAQSAESKTVLNQEAPIVLESSLEPLEQVNKAETSLQESESNPDQLTQHGSQAEAPSTILPTVETPAVEVGLATKQELDNFLSDWPSTELIRPLEMTTAWAKQVLGLEKDIPLGELKKLQEQQGRSNPDKVDFKVPLQHYASYLAKSAPHLSRQEVAEVVLSGFKQVSEDAPQSISGDASEVFESQLYGKYVQDTLRQTDKLVRPIIQAKEFVQNWPTVSAQESQEVLELGEDAINHLVGSELEGQLDEQDQAALDTWRQEGLRHLANVYADKYPQLSQEDIAKAVLEAQSNLRIETLIAERSKNWKIDKGNDQKRRLHKERIRFKVIQDQLEQSLPKLVQDRAAAEAQSQPAVETQAAPASSLAEANLPQEVVTLESVAPTSTEATVTQESEKAESSPEVTIVPEAGVSSVSPEVSSAAQYLAEASGSPEQLSRAIQEILGQSPETNLNLALSALAESRQNISGQLQQQLIGNQPAEQIAHSTRQIEQLSIMRDKLSAIQHSLEQNQASIKQLAEEIAETASQSDLVRVQELNSQIASLAAARSSYQQQLAAIHLESNLANPSQSQQVDAQQESQSSSQPEAVINQPLPQPVDVRLGNAFKSQNYEGQKFIKNYDKDSLTTKEKARLRNYAYKQARQSLGISNAKNDPRWQQTLPLLQQSVQDILDNWPDLDQKARQRRLRQIANGAVLRSSLPSSSEANPEHEPQESPEQTLATQPQRLVQRAAAAADVAELTDVLQALMDRSRLAVASQSPQANNLRLRQDAAMLEGPVLNQAQAIIENSQTSQQAKQQQIEELLESSFRLPLQEAANELTKQAALLENQPKARTVRPIESDTQPSLSDAEQGLIDKLNAFAGRPTTKQIKGLTTSVLDRLTNIIFEQQPDQDKAAIKEALTQVESGRLARVAESMATSTASSTRQARYRQLQNLVDQIKGQAIEVLESSIPLTEAVSSTEAPQPEMNESSERVSTPAEATSEASPWSSIRSFTENPHQTNPSEAIDSALSVITTDLVKQYPHLKANKIKNTVDRIGRSRLERGAEPMTTEDQANSNQIESTPDSRLNRIRAIMRDIRSDVEPRLPAAPTPSEVSSTESESSTSAPAEEPILEPMETIIPVEPILAEDTGAESASESQAQIKNGSQELEPVSLEEAISEFPLKIYAEHLANYVPALKDRLAQDIKETGLEASDEMIDTAIAVADNNQLQEVMERLAQDNRNGDIIAEFNNRVDEVRRQATQLVREWQGQPDRAEDQAE